MMTLFDDEQVLEAYAEDIKNSEARENARTMVEKFWRAMPLRGSWIMGVKVKGQGEVSKTYSFPKSYVSYRKPRTVSTEQRERARQMMIAKNKAKGV